MAIKKLLDIVLTSLSDGKAKDIDLFDVKKITSMSDYVLIASGNSKRQVNALADKLIQRVKENKFLRWEVKDHFWVDPIDGFVWKSIQNLAPKGHTRKPNSEF